MIIKSNASCIIECIKEDNNYYKPCTVYKYTKQIFYIYLQFLMYQTPNKQGKNDNSYIISIITYFNNISLYESFLRLKEKKIFFIIYNVIEIIIFLIKEIYYLGLVGIPCWCEYENLT